MIYIFLSLKFHLGRNGRMEKCQHDVLHNSMYRNFFFLFFLISIFHFSWHAKNIIHRDEWIALHSRLNGLKRHASRQMAILVCLPCTYRSYKQKHLKNVTIFPSTKNTSFISGAQNSPLKKNWSRRFLKLMSILFQILFNELYITNFWKPRKPSISLLNSSTEPCIK